MLTQLRIQNFKSWRDTGQMRFAPLTGFFGPNSSGKTSILQFLLMLKQTVESTDYDTTLEIGNSKRASYVDLGIFTDIIFQHQHSDSISFEFEWETSESFQEFTVIKTDQFEGFDPSNKILFTASIKSDVENNILVDALFYEIGNYHIELKLQKIIQSNPIEHSRSNTKYELLISSPREQENYPDTRLFPIKFYGFSGVINSITSEPEIVFYLVSQLENFFQQISYLGPLRDYPKRTYLWSGSRVRNVGNQGEFTIPALLSDNLSDVQLSFFDGALSVPDPGAQSHVANWLKKLGLIHDFNLLPLAEGRKEYEVRIRQTENSPEVLLTEVGFGVSQIIPVLTLCYYVPLGSTIILEQPEIHLHPAVQAGLADVFIDVIKNRGVQIILESHSEHLLYRLQRRMAEEKLLPEDVALYFTHMENGESKLDELKIDEYGSISNWPENFFGDRMDDLVAAAEATMKRQGINEL